MRSIALSGWGLKFDYFGKDSDFDRHQGRLGSESVARLADPKVTLEPQISWHSAMFFRPTTADWTTIYNMDGKPVVIERTFGKGSIVCLADSYLLSNEAMRRERCPKFLSWLIGTPSSVVFDEESHGVRDDPGIVSLVRKYGLEGAVAALLLLAMLFVWKSVSPLVPPFEEAETSGTEVVGKQAEEGFTNLLRRSIPPRELLRVCAD